MRCSRAKTRVFSNMAGSIGAASPAPWSRTSLSGSAKEGASSITQQLARNSLPLGGRTLSRKLLEAMVALRIEHDFTKQQILEALHEPDLFRLRLLRSRNRVAGLLRKERLETESFRSRDPGRSDSQPESFFAAQESGRRRRATKHGARSDARAEKDHRGAGRAGEAGQGHFEPEAAASNPGELRDGRGAA